MFATVRACTALALILGTAWPHRIVRHSTTQASLGKDTFLA